MDPVPSTQAAGQISADGQFRWDGQQWVPLPANYREPTSWTRPMQLITAALFAISAISGVVITIAFVNHDSVLRAIHAQGTQIPVSTSAHTVGGPDHQRAVRGAGPGDVRLDARRGHQIRPVGHEEAGPLVGLSRREA